MVPFEFSLNGFTESIEFSDKNELQLKIFKLADLQQTTATKIPVTDIIFKFLPMNFFQINLLNYRPI